MSRFSLLYGTRAEAEADSPRMRRRVYAAFDVQNDSRLATIIQRELGVEVPSSSWGYIGIHSSPIVNCVIC
jgi:hypothetical protein